MKFRDDIQVLRGFAVLFVVLFHLEIAGAKSGFLGVDVFFVISGFLMAVLYKEDKTHNFFLKRARRLLPTYFFVAFSTLIVSFFIVTPNEFRQVANQGVYASFFASNVGFWLQNSYFSKSEFNPLLHFWSLAVEIHFYLIIPFLFRIFKFRTAILPIILIAGALGCFFIIENSPKTAFFMMPARIWEFLIGYYVAKRMTENGNVKKDRPLISIACLIALIFVPFIHVSTNEHSFIYGHPGIIAMIVSVLTGTILWAGMPNQLVLSPFGRLFVTLGKYSYSIYLVHFPVIVLFLYQPFSGTNLHPTTPVDTAVLILIIAILSIATYHLVESKWNKLTKLRYCILPISALILLSIFLNATSRNLHSENDNKIFNAFTDRSQFRCGKIFRFLNPKSSFCFIGEPKDGAESVFLIGDSHSDSIKDSFAKIARQKKINVLMPINNSSLTKNGIGAEKVFRDVLKSGAKHVVLHYSPMRIDINKVANFLSMVKDSEIKVSLILPIPVWDEHVPKSLYLHAKRSEEPAKLLLFDYNKANEALFSELSKFNYSFLSLYETSPYFCPANECLLADKDGRPLYFDSEHLTLTGAKYLEPLFKIILE